MRFGIVGLGRMGTNLARLAMDKGHEVVGYNKDPQATKQLVGEGIVPADSLEQLVSELDGPRVVLIYVPHGEPTEEVCGDLRELLEQDDIVIDGGNSHWGDSQRRSSLFAETGVRFLDVGTSGGIEGARHGACFMVGGARDAYELIAPLLRSLAADDEAVFFAGGPGAGHFVKLVHNAIEFGMVQAISEGVELLDGWEEKLDMPGLFENWMHGSVIRSWLVELMGKALGEQTDLAELSTYVEDTGEVKWVLDWALERDIPVPVTSASQTALMQYRDLDSPQAKAHALLRNQYGGHPVHRVDDKKARR
jgi:6-phosphogluconate dehydrogenase